MSASQDGCKEPCIRMRLKSGPSDWLTAIMTSDFDRLSPASAPFRSLSLLTVFHGEREKHTWGYSEDALGVHGMTVNH